MCVSVITWKEGAPHSTIVLVSFLNFLVMNSAENDKELRRARIKRRITALQFQPVSSLPMTLFLLWMVGNDIGIFSIMFVGMAIMNPITALSNTKKVFEQFDADVAEDNSLRSDVMIGRLCYAGCCLIAMFVGLLKVSWMGLLPVSAVDWMNHAPAACEELGVAAILSGL